MNSFFNEILTCKNVQFKKYQNDALEIKLKNFGNSMSFFAPSLLYYAVDQYENRNKNKFISISITGNKCQLQCDHCKSKILDSMYPAETPELLLDLVDYFVKNKNCG